MLEDAGSARRRGAQIVAEIKGHGSAYDLSRGARSTQAVAAIARGIRMSLQDAGMDVADIDCVSASANGSRHIDRHEAQALAEVFEDRVTHLPIMGIKSMLGETLGASGALQNVLFLSAMQDRILPGIRGLEHLDDDFPLAMVTAQTQQRPLRHGLINSVGLDGHACALIVGQFDAS